MLAYNTFIVEKRAKNVNVTLKNIFTSVQRVQALSKPGKISSKAVYSEINLLLTFVHLNIVVCDERISQSSISQHAW